MKNSKINAGMVIALVITVIVFVLTVLYDLSDKTIGFFGWIS